MIPITTTLTERISNVEHPGRTYCIDETGLKITGYVDGLDAIAQTVYTILGTERYMYPIYSWDYGVELYSLIGKPMPYVISEIPRRIKEALTTDNRITDVVDFTFEQSGKSLHVSFTVTTELGGIPIEMEVSV